MDPIEAARVARWKLYLAAVAGVLWTVFAVAVVILILRVSTLQNQLSAQSATSCTVQKRGLQAQPHLLAFLGDLAKLITPAPGTKVPPGKEAEFALLLNAHTQLDLYLEIEHRQPKTRHCSTS